MVRTGGFFAKKLEGRGELTDVSRKSNPPPPIMRTDVGVGELITNINNLGLGGLQPIKLIGEKGYFYIYRMGSYIHKAATLIILLVLIAL